MYQIVRATELVAEAETWGAAEAARSLLADEMRLHLSHLIVLHPAGAVYPTAGGGTATARELGLPLVEAS